MTCQHKQARLTHLFHDRSHYYRPIRIGTMTELKLFEDGSYICPGWCLK